MLARKTVARGHQIVCGDVRGSLHTAEDRLVSCEAAHGLKAMDDWAEAANELARITLATDAKRHNPEEDAT